jgi:hypothetical protein
MKNKFSKEEIDYINDIIRKKKYRLANSINDIQKIDVEKYVLNYSLHQLRTLFAYLTIGFSFDQSMNLSLLGLDPHEFSQILKSIKT